MDIKDLKTLIKMVTDTDITEFKMETKEEKVLIRRGPEKEIVHMAAPQQFAAQPMPTAAAPASAPVAAPVAVESAEKVLGPNQEIVTSPIVGTFYRKPSPDADVFSEVGSVIEAGATLCLVEAMKMFNEIEADFKCKVVEILKDDSAPVEYGESLFIVERL